MIACIVDDELKSAKHLGQLVSLYQKDWKIEIFTNAGEALVKIKEIKPEILFLDIEMPILSGFELLERIHQVGLNPYTIIVSAHSHYAVKGFRFAVFDYLLKPIDIEELKCILNRLPWNTQSKFSNSTNPNVRSLISSREFEIFELLKKGLAVEQIADILIISPKTVASHKKSIYKKLDIHSQPELIAKLG